MSESTNPAEGKKVYVTLAGLPLSVELEWPFRKSSAGADFWFLHADIRLEGGDLLHAPVAVNLSATVREIVPSLEPKDIEGPVINALRKEVDNRQLEFVKSGKLLPVQFSSRLWDFKRSQWAFGKANDEIVATLLERKIYWQNKLYGGDVWVGDETDAMYLQTTTDHLAQIANDLASGGLIRLERRWATPLPAMLAKSSQYENARQMALAELEKKHAFERA